MMLGLGPAEAPPDSSLFPIIAITASFREKDLISHRDVLGTLMSLQLKREAIGDILIDHGRAVFFVSKTVAPPILQEIKLIGGVGVSLKEHLPNYLPLQKRTEERRGIVSSMRLDCVVALFVAAGRQQAQKMILSGQVQKNAQTIENLSALVLTGDKISIRGYGKYEVEEVGSPTKKDRLHITFLKYI